MAQTVKSVVLSPDKQRLFFGRPHTLSRIFVRIAALLPTTSGYTSKISFDDASFTSYYTLMGGTSYFEAKGEGIFQGNILVRNQSPVSIKYTATEILV